MVNEDEQQTFKSSKTSNANSEIPSVKTVPQEISKPHVPEEKEPEKSWQDVRGKGALDKLQSLVNSLRDLTSAEARIAKTSKTMWMEVEKSNEAQSMYDPKGPTKKIVITEKESEVKEVDVVSSASSEDAQKSEENEVDELEPEEEEDKVLVNSHLCNTEICLN